MASNWECPRCTRIYGPTAVECGVCNDRVDVADQKLEVSKSQAADKYRLGLLQLMMHLGPLVEYVHRDRVKSVDTLVSEKAPQRRFSAGVITKLMAPIEVSYAKVKNTLNLDYSLGEFINMSVDLEADHPRIQRGPDGNDTCVVCHQTWDPEAKAPPCPKWDYILTDLAGIEELRPGTEVVLPGSRYRTAKVQHVNHAQQGEEGVQTNDGFFDPPSLRIWQRDLSITAGG